jgi:hypothetical protein
MTTDHENHDSGSPVRRLVGPVLETPKFIVVNIGCLECGVPSNLVGVFLTEIEAQAIATACEEKYQWREGGQNAFEVFPMPEVGAIHPDYADVRPNLKDDRAVPAPVHRVVGQQL